MIASPPLPCPSHSALYFVANDGVHGRELWSYSTLGGTAMVRDIYTGTASSDPAELKNLNGELVFTADDGVHGRELWKSDGTAAGTVLVKDINAGAGSSNPQGMTALGSKVYFQAFDQTNGAELWTTDGTAAGTVLVKNIAPGKAGSSPANLTAFGNAIYFNGFTLAAGTVLAAGGLAWLLSTTSLLQLFELKTYDLRFVLRGKESPPGNIVLVLMDDRTEAAIPEPRIFWQPYFAALFRSVAAGGAKAIGLDVSFAISVEKWEPDADRQLAAAFAEVSPSAPIVLAYDTVR